MTEVVNVKVARLRPRYENLCHWTQEPDNVYIGRAGVVFIDGRRFPPRASVWANPFKIQATVSRHDVIAKYEAYIRECIQRAPEQYNIEALRGKRLGCWCHPEPCHGDVLLRLLEETQ